MKKKPPKILAIDEEQRLLDWTHHNRSFRDYVVILTILRTGLRTHELREILVSDISTDGKILTNLEVRAEIARCEERSNLKPRTFPIPNDLRKQLSIFLDWKRQRGESVEEMSFLFASAKSSQITVRHLQRIIRESTQGALGKPYRSHDLRRTWQARLENDTNVECALHTRTDSDFVGDAHSTKALNHKDTETTFSDSAKSESEQNLKSLSSAKLGEVEIVQPKPCIWQTYDATDGLPGGVNKLLQDQRGNLWLATVAGWPILGTGLVRYNGAEFITYTTADGLADDLVSALCEDRHGRLWFGTRRGLTIFDGERFVSITEFADDAAAETLARCWISAICEDSRGRLWFGTGSEWVPSGHGVICFDGEDFQVYTTTDGLVNDDILSICEDRHGHLWFGTRGGVSRFDGKRFTNYTTDDGLMGNFAITLCEDRSGRLWVGCGGGWFFGGVSVFDGKQFVPFTGDEAWMNRSIRAIYEDRHGRLWIGVWGIAGVSMLKGEKLTTFTAEDGLQDNLVSDILQDQEGGIWFAHLFNGATRLDVETLQLLTTEQVNDTLIQDRGGRLWFANDVTLLSLADGEQTRRTSEYYFPLALLADCRGALWVGWGADAGVSRYDSFDAVWGGGDRRFTTVDGLGSNHVVSLLETRNGTIWVGTRDPGTLCRFDGERFESTPVPFPIVTRLFEDSHGRIWCGGWSSGGQLACYDGDALVTYTVIEGSLDDGIGSIVEDDSGVLWVGTTHGLYRFDGEQFIRYDKDKELASICHQWSVKDAAGQLWFGTLRGGLYRYDGKYFQQLSTADGLPNNSVTGLIPQPDGSMIISTFRGIVHYRPTATLPPGIEIREVIADQIYRNPTELELATAGTDLLLISYRGLSFSTRRMRYSCILEGHDKVWRETWDETVRYENLPPGDYTFKVIAINRDLMESEAPATLKLTVLPDPRDLKIATMQTEIDHLRREVSGKYDFENIIGRSDAIKKVRRLMELAIDSGLDVLITGETGT
ncbi:MAG: two-component regulator propeller domain-containing protein, partial [Candidatus Poribacteria bacterium]